jgi:hypothetical protein
VALSVNALTRSDGVFCLAEEEDDDLKKFMLNPER